VIVLAAVESQPPPEKNPALGRNPHFCYCRIEPFGDFFGNDTTRTPDPIRPTRRGPDPNRRTATKGILSGGVGHHLQPRQTFLNTFVDSRTTAVTDVA